jgi:mRNA-degrading endonuclease toxin of MazEF toxin-antitoxin module
MGHVDFARTGLRFRSVFRTHKLALLHKSLVLRQLGELEGRLMNDIDLRLQIALGLMPAT